MLLSNGSPIPIEWTCVESAGIYTFRVLPHGEMVEWFKAPVLKTGEVQASGGSNPSLSATLLTVGISRRFFLSNRGMRTAVRRKSAKRGLRNESNDRREWQSLSLRHFKSTDLTDSVDFSFSGGESRGSNRLRRDSGATNARQGWTVVKALNSAHILCIFSIYGTNTALNRFFPPVLNRDSQS